MTDTPCRVSIDELEYDFRNQDEDIEKKVECVIEWAIKRIKKGDVIKAGRFTFTLSEAIDSIDTENIAALYVDSFRLGAITFKDLFNDLVSTAVEELCRSWEDDIYAEYKDHVSLHDNKYTVCL